ncbi:MAG: methyltransferase domain-containing protein [Patescibacteria group bacterium]|nr:methyltransferase domain-containing protein [Patescibacteria group bacterium]
MKGFFKKTLGHYSGICYYEFSPSCCIKNREKPMIWHGNYVVLNFINKNIKKFLTRFDGKDLSILDLGCGNKPYKKILKYKKYLGVDYFNNLKADLNFDLNEPLILEEKFDIILCLDVMEHVKNTGNLLKTVDNNLKSGGVLLISAPFFYGLHGSPHDYHRFTRNFFENLDDRVLKLMEIKESNTYFSSLILHLNNIIFYIPIPYFLKYPFYFVNNIFAITIDSVFLFFLKILNYKKIRELIFNAPMEYFVVYEKIEE